MVLLKPKSSEVATVQSRQTCVNVADD